MSDQSEATRTTERYGKRRTDRAAFPKGSGAFLTLAALGGTGAWFAAGPSARPAAAQTGLPLPEPPSLPVSRAGAWRRPG